MKKTFVLCCLCLSLAVTVLTGCGGRLSQAADEGDVMIDFAPGSTALGDTTLIFTVTDGDGNPVEGADLAVKGDMTHAGMIPVLADGETGADGTVELPWAWTMGGNWIVTVEANLPDGVIITRRFDQLLIDGEVADDMEMGSDSSMDHGALVMAGDLTVSNPAANLALPSDTGAVYLTIANGGATADTLTGAIIDGCETIEIHESKMNDGVMTMRPIDGGELFLPAGETVALARGGIHLMCLGKGGFDIGQMVPVTLTFAEAGDVELMVPVVDPAEIGSTEMDMDHGEGDVDGELEYDE